LKKIFGEMEEGQEEAVWHAGFAEFLHSPMDGCKWKLAGGVCKIKGFLWWRPLQTVICSHRFVQKFSESSL